MSRMINVNNPNPYHPGKRTALPKPHVTPEAGAEDTVHVKESLVVETPKPKHVSAPKVVKPKAEAKPEAPKVAETPKPAPVKAEPVATWEVVLTDAGESPIALVRELRELLGKDLKDIEVMISFLPDVVQKGLSQDDANALKAKLEAAGGKVELKQQV